MTTPLNPAAYQACLAAEAAYDSYDAASTTLSRLRREDNRALQRALEAVKKDGLPPCYKTESDLSEDLFKNAEFEQRELVKATEEAERRYQNASQRCIREVARSVPPASIPTHLRSTASLETYLERLARMRRNP